MFGCIHVFILYVLSFILYGVALLTILFKHGFFINLKKVECSNNNGPLQNSNCNAAPKYDIPLRNKLQYTQ